MDSADAGGLSFLFLLFAAADAAAAGATDAATDADATTDADANIPISLNDKRESLSVFSLCFLAKPYTDYCQLTAVTLKVSNILIPNSLHLSSFL